MPRSLQIILRRRIILRKRELYKDIWPIDSRANKSPEGWSGWPDGKRFALVLTHDVDTGKGQERCMQLMELEKNLGFKSSFNFVPERYRVSSKLFRYLGQNGFEIGVHGLRHDGNPFRSREIFDQQAIRINRYIKAWNSAGFRCQSMYHNLEYMLDLNIEYDASTFDTDPYEPQSDGAGTIFPFRVKGASNGKGYVELPYTLPQDFTLFILMQEKGIDIWKRKLDWIARYGGMALMLTHPDYMNIGGKKKKIDEYPASFYLEFLKFVKHKYEGDYWHVLPKEMGRFWIKNYLLRVN